MLESWRDEAECFPLPQEDKDKFFSEDDRDVLASQLICSNCPVIEECLAFALRTRQPFGVFGMHTEQDRRTLKRFLTLRPSEAQAFWDRSFEKIQHRVTRQLAVHAERPESPPVTAVAS